MRAGAREPPTALDIGKAAEPVVCDFGDPPELHVEDGLLPLDLVHLDANELPLILNF